MKFNYDGFEIEIKAKTENGRYNRQDTMRIINHLSFFADYAAKEFERRSKTALAEDAQEFANITYDLLHDAGYYNR